MPATSDQPDQRPEPLTASTLPSADEPSPAQPRNPLHGVTLQAMLEALELRYGWAGLGERIPLRCFTHEPSVNSCLKLLRKTPWAREKVEGLYLFMLREQRRGMGSGLAFCPQRGAKGKT